MIHLTKNDREILFRPIPDDAELILTPTENGFTASYEWREKEGLTSIYVWGESRAAAIAQLETAKRLRAFLASKTEAVP